MIRKSLFLAFFTLLLFPLVGAVSISPGIIDLTGDDGPISEEFTIRVTNSESNEVTMLMNYSGPLSQYMSLDRDKFQLGPRERAEVTLYIDIPDNHGLVGPQNNKVRARTADTTGGGFVRIQTSVATRFEIFFPFPGVYLELDDFTVPSAEVGEDTQASWNLFSRGEQGTPFDWQLEIINEEIVYESSGSATIGGEDQDNFQNAIPSSSFEIGEYEANLIITYGDSEISAKESFRVGDAGVELLTFYPQEFEAGSVNRFVLGTSNQWPNPLENVLATVQINNYITSTPTLETLMGVDDKLGGQHRFEHFLDLTEFEPGEYEAQIVFRFETDGESDSTSYTRNITLVEDLDTPAATQNTSVSEFDPVVIFLILITIITSIFGIGALYLLYNKKDE